MTLAPDDPTAPTALGAIELGGTRVRCAWGTGAGEVLGFDEGPTGTPEATLARVRAFFASAPAIAALGVAAFGPLELDPEAPRWGHVLATPKPGWSGTPLGPRLREALGVPVALETDVNAAALAEAAAGAARGADPAAYLTVGTGIGLGVVAAGRALHGLLHPEAGHLRLRREPDDGFAGSCPLHGDCWEGLASGPAVAARWGADPGTLGAGAPGLGPRGPLPRRRPGLGRPRARPPARRARRRRRAGARRSWRASGPASARRWPAWSRTARRAAPPRSSCPRPSRTAPASWARCAWPPGRGRRPGPGGRPAVAGAHLTPTGVTPSGIMPIGMTLMSMMTAWPSAAAPRTPSASARWPATTPSPTARPRSPSSCPTRATARTS